jgi:hypothetical protein
MDKNKKGAIELQVVSSLLKPKKPPRNGLAMVNNVENNFTAPLLVYLSPNIIQCWRKTGSVGGAGIII